MSNKLLGIELTPQTREEVLEKIKKNVKNPSDFFHVASLNPEIFIVASKNDKFREVIKKAQIRIVDGVGVVLASRLLHVRLGERFVGVDLMTDLLNIAHDYSLRVMLIGAGPKVADKVVECQGPKFPKAKFFSLQGIKDIKNPKEGEEKKIFSIVTDFKPHLMFVAFGSPWQEMWLYRNRARLRGVVCMGVGGAFDYLSGTVPRAPKILQRAGLEWLFRLTVQPWRVGRQVRIVKFLLLVMQERLRKGTGR